MKTQQDQEQITQQNQEQDQLQQNQEYQQQEVEASETQKLTSSYYANRQNPFPEYDIYGQVKLQKKYTPFRIAKILIASGLLIFNYILFVVIMEHECPLDKYPTDDDCTQYLIDNISLWVVIVLIIGGIINLVYQLASKRIFERFFMLAAIALYIYLSFFKYEISLSEVKVREFSAAHALFVMLITAGIAGILLVIQCCVGIFRFSRVFFGLIYFVLFCLFVWLYVEADKSCDGWEKGLTGELKNEGTLCYVESPWVCWPTVVDNLLNLGAKTCKQDEFQSRQTKKDALKKYGFYKGLSKSEQDDLFKNTRYIAWPNLKYFSDFERRYDVIQKLFQERSKIVSSPSEAFAGESETVIDLEKNELLVNVRRNETYVQNAKKAKQDSINKGKNVQNLSENIIILYIDTLSRVHAHRKLPKTFNYLKKFVSNGRKDTSKEVFEFYRFHAIDKKTNNNAFKMQFDHLYKEVYDDEKNGNQVFKESSKINNLMNDFREAGYITAHIMNTCTAQCLFREKYEPIQKYFQEAATDHEFTIWDPLYVNPDNYYDVGVGPSSIVRRCLYQNDTSAYMSQYGLQFMKAYENEPKAIFLEYTDAHELTNEIIQYLDDHLYNFLLNIDAYTDKSTVIYFISDHGQHLIQPFYKKEDQPDPKNQYKEMAYQYPTQDVYQIERMLPLLIMIVSRDILNALPEQIETNLITNEQIVFGMGHYRNTMMANAFGLSTTKYTDNLWNPRNPERSCKDIGQIDELDPKQYCMCRPYNWKDEI